MAVVRTRVESPVNYRRRQAYWGLGEESPPCGASCRVETDHRIVSRGTVENAVLDRGYLKGMVIGHAGVKILFVVPVVNTGRRGPRG